MVQQDIKKSFYSHFNRLLRNEQQIMFLFYEIFVIGSAYVVGGYFRDFINGKKSRDLDVLVDLDSESLTEILNTNKYQYIKNRHGGIKIKFDTISLDMWSIQDNWAFKNDLVKLNEDDKLNSIAKGCFYNYDSLVINLHNFTYSLKYYNEFRKSNTLDILQSRPLYGNLNPTIEANILRAFYIKQNFHSTYSNNTFKYLLGKIGALNDNNDNQVILQLLKTKEKYPKYNSLTEKIILEYINDLKSKDNPGNQFIIDL